MQHPKKVLYKKNLIQGFSLPELVVTIAIISIVTGIVLFRYSSFNSSVLLSSQAYELALDVRETQVLGLSVRAEGSGGSAGNFREEYGLYFDTSTVVAKSQYIFFQDNGTAVPARRDSSGSEDVNIITLDTRYEINRICVNNANCSTIAQDIAISFKRPDFDAKFFARDSSGTSLGTVNSAFIEISPINNTATRTVSIYNTGQISVN